jgi:hypothetical protein
MRRSFERIVDSFLKGPRITDETLELVPHWRRGPTRQVRRGRLAHDHRSDQ